MESVKQVNVTFLATVAAAVAASFLIGIFSVLTGGDQMVALLLSQAVYFLPTAFYLWKSKFNLKETIRLHPIKPTTVLLLAAFMYLLIPAITLINAISLKFTTNTIDTTVTSIVAKYPFFIGLLTIAIIPGILEECVYRGVFFNEYRKVNPRKAVVLSGLLFGLAHMNFNQFIYAFLLGMVFSIVVEATDSILASMVLHFVMNGTSVAMVYVQENLVESGVLEETLQEVQSTDIYIRNGWPAAFIGTVLAFFVLKAIAKNQGREKELEALLKKRGCAGKKEFPEQENLWAEETFERKKDEKNPRLVTLALWLGIIVCLGVMLLVEVL